MSNAENFESFDPLLGQKFSMSDYTSVTLSCHLSLGAVVVYFIILEHTLRISCLGTAALWNYLMETTIYGKFLLKINLISIYKVEM